MAATNQSLLLQCLSKLDDDAWVEVLLPFLMANGSATVLTQTCTQLRDKVFRAVWGVALANLDLIPATSSAADWVAPLPKHFVNCKSMALPIRQEQDFSKFQHTLPAISRLPKLRLLRVCAQCSPAPVPLAMLLQSMCTALTGLRELWVQFDNSWPQTKLVWQEVAFFSHLTALYINYRIKEDMPLTEGDLAPLSRLCNLQTLTLQPYDLPQLPHGEPQPATAESEWLQCLGGMTSLTALTLNWQQLSGLEHVSACSNLVSLELSHAPRCKVTDAQWSAIGQLTKLTHLSFSPEEGAPSAACYDALRKLTRLRSLGGYGWTKQALPLFSDLTGLTCLTGSWEPASDSFLGARVSCPYVWELGGVRGPVPFAAFPNLRVVCHVGILPVSAITELRRCQELEEINADFPRVSAGAGMDVSLPPAEPLAARVAAVKSLAKLHKLTGITLMPSENAEIAAFAELVATLRGKALRRVGLVVVPGTRVSFTGLMPFGNLSGLQQFYLDVSRVDASWLGGPAPLLCKMNGVARLHLVISSRADVPRWRRVIDELGAAGLGQPSMITLTVVAG